MERPQEVPHIVSIKVAFPVTDERDALEKRSAIMEILADLPNSKMEFSVISLPGGIEAGSPDNARTVDK